MNPPLHVRYAEPRDAEAVWSLYQRTGFLYPAKLEAMGDGGKQARATFEALLALSPDDFAVVLCFDESETLCSACTYGRFSDTQGWMMHLASDRDRAALLQAVVGGANAAAASSAEWAAWTFRETNSSVRRLFTAPLERVRGEGWSVEFAGHDFYSISAAQARCLERETGRTARPATERDRGVMLDQLGAATPEGATLLAQGAFHGGRELYGLAARFASVGLSRERAAIVVDGEDGPAGLAILDLAPAWWNLSNLSTGMSIWQRGNDPEVAATLLSYGARWFAARSVANWTLLVGEGDAAVGRILGEVGLSSTRRYQRLTMPMETLPIFNAAYARFIGRSMELPRVLTSSEARAARILRAA